METARNGDIPDPRSKLRYRRNGAFMANLSLRAVDLLMTVAGGNAIYQSNPLQRAFRDIHAAVSHISLNWEPAAIGYGRHALGLPVDNPLL